LGRASESNYHAPVRLAFMVVSFLVASVGCTVLPLPAGRSTLLPESAAHAVVQQCSRPAPTAIDGTWVPDEATLAELDRQIPRVARMSATCCTVGLKLRSVSDSYVQYVGIVLNGRRYIYVNGVRGSEPPPNWRHIPVMACDGGSYFWGALYDPETRRFSEFAVNGSA
jgi:hypothetical protein